MLYRCWCILLKLKWRHQGFANSIKRWEVLPRADGTSFSREIFFCWGEGGWTWNTFDNLTLLRCVILDIHLSKLVCLTPVARFFFKQHFCKLKLIKLSNTSRLNFAIWKYSLSSSTLSAKRYSKKCDKKKCVCFDEVIWLMTEKMRLQMRNKSYRCDINR